ncbi:CDP-glycerol glycerophosphotransferase family protein [Paeniglutamicibacter sp. NPDC091659]|uniref:CDP-glycerol glycerophosphotransferase family protein n=1 Tax=Paeniglutamicibacter sp. NPDC091659 TaxID=3364389 RepID=UPI0038095113
MVAAKADSVDEIALVALAILAGMVAIVGEQVLRRIGLGGGPSVLNMPGVTAPPRVLRMNKTIALGQLFYLGVGAATGVMGLSSVWWLLSGVLVVSLTAVRALSVVRRRRANMRTERKINTLVADYAPEFAIYTARPDDASYQVAMWLPYLQRTGKKFIIITRAEVPSQALAEITDAPIIMRKRLAGLDDLIVPSLSTVFYVNASSGNGAMVRYNQLTHVYLGHGDSDKAPSYNPTHAMYDRIYAAGKAATRRYADHGVIIDQDKFDIVGRPQLESVTVAGQGVPANPTVLYAPTWRGHVEETFLHSIPVAKGIVSSLLSGGSRVIFRPHPFSYHYPEDAAIIAEVQELLRADAATSGKNHLWGAAAELELDIIGCMNASDAMISDVSSVVSDYLYSGKPFAMVAVNVPVADFSTEYPIARAAYVFDASLSALDDVLDTMLGTDPMYGQRQDLRVDYLGDFPREEYAEAFIGQARLTIEQGSHLAANIEFDADEASAEPSVDSSETESEGDAPVEADGSTVPEVGKAAAPRAGQDANAMTANAPRGRVRNAFLGLIKQILPNVFAALALTAAAVTDFRSLWFLAPAVLAIAFFLYANRRGWRSKPAMNRALGAMAPARATIAATLAVELLAASHDVSAAVGAGLVFLAISLEGQVAAAWKADGLQSMNLPGTEKARPLPFSRGWAGMLSALVLLAMLILSYLVPAADTVLAVLGAVSFAVTAYVLIAGLRRRYINLVLESKLPELLADVAPRFCVYFGSNVGVSYQLGMWVPYLDRIGLPYIVVTRDLKMMRAAAKVTDAPVIYRKSLGSLEAVLVPGLTTAFYVNNAVKNTHLIERRELHHIWLNHGDSEKPACFNPVHAIYDEIFAAGQAGIDRYERHGVHIPVEKFTVVGRPQVEEIQQSTSTEPARTVLYAPTWRGPYADSAVYSLPKGEEIVAGLLERGCTVVFRAHPFNYNFPDAVQMIRNVIELLKADASVSGREHVYGAAAETQMSFVECFNACDAMISDVSAMVSDFLYSTKPFAVVAVQTDEAGLHQSMPATASGYVLQESLGNYPEVLDCLLETDPLASLRSGVKDYYLGSFPAESYVEGFLGTARQRILARPGVPAS